MSSSSSSSSPSSSSEASVESARRTIRLRRAAQTRFVLNAVDGFRFTVTAHSANDMPNEIFLYIRRPADAGSGEVDEFTCICSAPDLEEYPTEGPTGLPPFFRLAEIDLVFRSQSLADEAWTVIKRDVEVLVHTLNLNDELAVTDDIEIG